VNITAPGGREGGGINQSFIYLYGHKPSLYRGSVNVKVTKDLSTAYGRFFFHSCAETYRDNRYSRASTVDRYRILGTSADVPAMGRLGAIVLPIIKIWPLL
jgi:hypothetical protein